MKSIVVSAVAAALLCFGASSASAQSPVVVELFTSQGCSSCPPADALLGELADEPGVIALAFHVDYWNYIGWADPFSKGSHTQRQRDYARAFGTSTIYTPQAVIQGQKDLVGSRRNALRSAIEAAAATPLATTATLDPAARELRIAAGEAPGTAAVLLVGYRRYAETVVTRGENAGRTLQERNIVIVAQPLGEWRGEALVLPFDPTVCVECDGYAVLVQDPTTGRVLAATKVERQTPVDSSS